MGPAGHCCMRCDSRGARGRRRRVGGGWVEQNGDAVAPVPAPLRSCRPFCHRRSQRESDRAIDFVAAAARSPCGRPAKGWSLSDGPFLIRRSLHANWSPIRSQAALTAPAAPEPPGPARGPPLSSARAKITKSAAPSTDAKKPRSPHWF